MERNYKSDFYRMTGIKFEKSRWKLIKLLLYHNLRYMYIYRKYQSSHNFIYKLLLYRLTRKYGLEISTEANLGEGIYLGHPYNITVAEGVVIGKNVNLHKGCTIGRENRSLRQGVPHIGDSVFVGINATIVGDCHIGNDVVIAPNAFVNFDVPDHSIVIGNPGEIHHKKNASAGYVNFLV